VPVLRVLKQRTGKAHARRAGSRLWQPGYHEQVLRDDEHLQAVVRYVLENPVRADLVRHPREYPHLGSDVWTLEELFP
jgi:putative transposase